jgi:undecaprenyl-diphosphatase
MLIVTGGLLWLSDRVANNYRQMRDMNVSDSIVVGLAQAFAILPGISRSGSTITAGLFKGLDRELAAKYSFMLSIPVIGGATLLKAKDLLSTGVKVDNGLPLVVGTLTSALVGYLAIKLLLKLIAKEKLSIFAYYCWGLGIMIILLFL